ncbi:hypothetical protein ACSNN7_12705 [Micromonospora sp. URMC 105]|uniref:hypothetical protein n=1 Tax=Micromonospora sp. URMC 105 TaxID=3423413 RepID=UPI003F193106
MSDAPKADDNPLDVDAADLSIFQDDDAEPADDGQAAGTASQTEALGLLRSVGYDAEHSHIDLAFKSFDGAHWFSIFKLQPNGKKERSGILPDYAIRGYVGELEKGWSADPDGLSIASADGRYVELMISGRSMRMRLRQTSLAKGTYTSPRSKCPSAATDGDHATAFSTAYGLEDRPIPGRHNGVHLPVVLHLGSGKGDCVEVSNPSATMAAIYYKAANGMRPTDYPRSASIKFRFAEGGSREFAIRRAREVAATLFFEMAAMGWHTIRLHEPLRERRRRLPRQRSGESVLRFPPQVVDARAASLFVGAEEATSPLSVYLSYYQSIEYYLPFSDERSTIARLRREIFSPGFDLGNDSSLLRLARAVGRQSNKSERESFQALLAFALPRDKSEAIFDGVAGRYKDHFGKRGPISDVGHVNTQDKRLLSDQIADRIYDLRCRIVHSKVSGGATGAEPLFPTDSQVDHLEADIELVRLVAIEVITVFATPNFRIGPGVS